jgi:hypothetical protein
MLIRGHLRSITFYSDKQHNVLLSAQNFSLQCEQFKPSSRPLSLLILFTRYSDRTSGTAPDILMDIFGTLPQFLHANAEIMHCKSQFPIPYLSTMYYSPLISLYRTLYRLYEISACRKKFYLRFTEETQTLSVCSHDSMMYLVRKNILTP